MSADILELKTRVCESGKKLLRKGLVARTWGNVSVRLNENEMIITPSGRKYDELKPQDMVRVNIHNLKYEGDIKPSSELKLHCIVYKTRPHIQAIIHTHQMMASVVAAAQVDLEVINETHQKILGGKIIRTAPYALPNTKKITHATEAAIQQSNAALMANHGVVCLGKNLEEAFEVAETLEEACKLFVQEKGKK